MVPPLLALLASSLLAAAPTAAAPEAAPAGSSDGEPVRYVRIELPGDARMLQLAEVWVVVQGANVAPEGQATQSTTHGDSAAARAIDGRTSGNHASGSVSHTAADAADAWWELDLGREVPVDQITVFNRTDCCGERLEGFRLALLDAEREVVWERAGIPAPTPRLDVAPFGAAVVDLGISAEERAALQPRIDRAIDRGLEHLRQTQLRDGSWAQHQNTHFSGQAALCLLTLVKGGAPLDDPAVRAARAFLRENSPEGTYGIGCMLMALEAIGDPEDMDQVRELTDRLVSTQGGRDAAGEHPGAWSYPLSPNTIACLSNTQYAILGLRSAQRMGVRISDRVFRRTAESLPEYRGGTERVKGIGPDPRGLEVAGFMYRAEGGHGGTSGSMTTAALAIMHVIRESFEGDLPRRIEADFDELERSAWLWLERNFSVEQNPGRGDSWHYYYLYGLERVGAFFERDLVGARDWYWEGARYLVDAQGDDGKWKNETDTCFAVLFLERATASKSGPTERRATEVHVAEAADAAVRWRGHGRRRATFWITGFGEGATRGLGGPAALRIAAVEYLVDGEVAQREELDGLRPWSPTDRHAVQLDLASRGEGTHEVGVRVTVVDPAATEGTGYATLEGAPLTVDVLPSSAPIDASFARHARANLVRTARVALVEASSRNNDGQAPARAVDGLHGTYWLAAKDDATPTLTIELARSVRARQVLLSHANVDLKSAGGHDRARVVELRINREREWTRHELDLDDRGKSVIELPRGKQVRRLELRVLEREAGTKWPGFVGFAEVELLGEERRR